MGLEGGVSSKAGLRARCWARSPSLWGGCAGCRSRLGCQLKVDKIMHGIVFRVPSASNNLQPEASVKTEQ